MAEAASAQQAASATDEDTSQQRAGRRRRTSADPQRAQQGAPAAAAPAALDTLSRLQQLADASPQAAQLRRLQALADARPQVAQLRRLQALADASPQAAQLRRLQALADAAAGIPSPTAAVEAAPPNRTGLPDGLKAGVESLSGLSMDHVRVHYNSSQPAQLNALAYAQGRDIHLAPGQERHLPHEAWHVVQQAQGRVRPTLQMKDGVQVNDDVGLEREADVMGAKAQQFQNHAWDHHDPLVAWQRATQPKPRRARQADMRATTVAGIEASMTEEIATASNYAGRRRQKKDKHLETPANAKARHAEVDREYAFEMAIQLRPDFYSIIHLTPSDESDALETTALSRAKADTKKRWTSYSDSDGTVQGYFKFGLKIFYKLQAIATDKAAWEKYLQLKKDNKLPEDSDAILSDEVQCYNMSEGKMDEVAILSNPPNKPAEHKKQELSAVDMKSIKGRSEASKRALANKEIIDQIKDFLLNATVLFSGNRCYIHLLPPVNDPNNKEYDGKSKLKDFDAVKIIVNNAQPDAMEYLGEGDRGGKKIRIAYDKENPKLSIIFELVQKTKDKSYEAHVFHVGPGG